MSSGIFSAAKLAANHAYLSEVIKQQSAAAPLPSSSSSPAPPAIAMDKASTTTTTTTTPAPLPTPPPSPDGIPGLVDDVEAKAVCFGISGKDKGKGSLTPASSPAPKPAPAPGAASSSPSPAPAASSPSPAPAPAPSAPARKLVTVRHITAVDTTTNRAATKLTINAGWTVGVDALNNKRASKFGAGGFFEVGHSVVFLEPDTLLPADHVRYGKLFAGVGNPIMWKGRKWFRVGTRRVGGGGNPRFPRDGFVSQGYVFALQDFEEIQQDVVHRARLVRFGGGKGEQEEERELVDYSGVLGAVKWEPYAHGDLSAAKDLGPLKNKSSVGNGSKKGNDSNSGNGGNGKKKGSSTPPAPSVKIPSWIKKTNIERVQNCPNLFTSDKYKHIVYQESVKIDGASMTCYFVPKTSKYFQKLHKPHPGPESASYSVLETGRFGVCSRYVDLPYSEECPYWAAAIKNDIASLMESLHKQGLGSHRGALAIQGEVVGPTISGNRYRLPAGTRSSFTIFSIWDIETQSRWGPRSVQDFCATHHLSHVEVIGYVKLRDIASSHAELLARANASQGEGLVFKSCAGDDRSFKVLSDRWITERGDKVDAREAAQLAGVETPSQGAVVKESEKAIEPQVNPGCAKNEEKKLQEDELQVLVEEIDFSYAVPTQKQDEKLGMMSEDKQLEKNVFVEEWLNGVEEAEKESSAVIKKRDSNKKPAVKQEPVVQESLVAEEEHITEAEPAVEEESTVEQPAAEEKRAVEEESALSEVSAAIEEPAVNNMPVIEKLAIEEKLVLEGPTVREESAVEAPADEEHVVGEPLVEKRVVEKRVVEEPSVEEKPAKQKSGELRDTTTIATTFTNAKEFLDSPVTWLGRPMKNGDAITEIGRIILAEMALNGKDVSVSLIKDLAQVVADELKFVKTDKDVANQEIAANEDTPTCIASTTPTVVNNPDAHSTPTTLDIATPTTHNNLITSNAPHESSSRIEVSTVPDAVAESVQQNIVANPTPPASEHNENDNNNELAGVNWDGYTIVKREGRMVAIPRNEYVPRERPCYYASAEELARRKEAKRQEREARRRYRRCF